uniref:Uncharacterized protein n=1 Tax=Utricularia reniformis TaxID=192314 RepID=A0A1Y0B1M1_9LAMI|nr:hypothetical protein AEK19_MT1039 [Utricularia reniformis]ART31263.1 hypothetical protein AEK19_MT1039 [Utricularia reniformis]
MIEARQSAMKCWEVYSLSCRPMATSILNSKGSFSNISYRVCSPVNLRSILPNESTC